MFLRPWSNVTRHKRNAWMGGIIVWFYYRKHARHDAFNTNRPSAFIFKHIYSLRLPRKLRRRFMSLNVVATAQLEVPCLVRRWSWLWRLFERCCWLHTELLLFTHAGFHGKPCVVTICQFRAYRDDKLDIWAHVKIMIAIDNAIFLVEKVSGNVKVNYCGYIVYNIVRCIII